MQTALQVVEALKLYANPDALAGMARYGISTENTLGINIPTLRKFARDIGKNHDLAEGLWDTGIHEARILAAYVDEPKQVTESQMELWVSDFDSWDVCDQVCSNLFDRTPYAYQKALEWSRREAEFIKRAGFVLMATLSVHDKKASIEKFGQFFPAILDAATDERNYVKKAVNWALRQIGKRSPELNVEAIQLAQEIKGIDSKSARWIASDALRELTSEKIQHRLHPRPKSPK